MIKAIAYLAGAAFISGVVFPFISYKRTLKKIKKKEV